MPSLKNNYRRYFNIGGMTIQVESEIPITDSTFQPKFKKFEVKEPGNDIITIQHYFSIPHKKDLNITKKVYDNRPWVVCRNDDSWIYITKSSKFRLNKTYQLSVINGDHTTAKIYNKRRKPFLKGNLHSLTLFTTDQILLARALADRSGCYMHSAGLVMDDQGFLFVGHSEAGKSTIVSILQQHSTILCDDRVIIRKWDDTFKIHGTWSHGDIPDVSSKSAPLTAIFFLEKASETKLIQLESKKEIAVKLLACLIKPLVTIDWWEKMLSLMEKISYTVPCYILKFKKNETAQNLRHLLKHTASQT